MGRKSKGRIMVAVLGLFFIATSILAISLGGLNTLNIEKFFLLLIMPVVGVMLFVFGIREKSEMEVFGNTKLTGENEEV